MITTNELRELGWPRAERLPSGVCVCSDYTRSLAGFHHLARLGDSLAWYVERRWIIERRGFAIHGARVGFQWGILREAIAAESAQLLAEVLAK